MAIPMPSWVDVNPRDFTAAAEGGARIGTQLQDIATNAALKRAELSQQAQEAAIRAQSDAQAHELEGQKLAIDSAQQQSELGLKQQQVEMETQKAAQQFQAQQQYQQLVSGGMDPVTAALHVGPGLLGESVGGLGTLKRADQAASFVPTASTIGGVDMIQRAPGQWTQARIPAEWEQTVDDNGVPVQRNTVTGEERQSPGTQKPPTDIQNENEVIRLNSERDKLISNNERYSEMLDAGDPPDPSWTKEQKATYASLNKRLSDIDAQIDKFSGGTAAPSSDSSMTNSTSSGLKYSIVPAQ